LERAVREIIYKNCGALSDSDLAGTQAVFAEGVKSLGGIERCSALNFLQLTAGAVSDLSPLSGLNTLQVLVLNGNQITDLSPLITLTNLLQLSLNDNFICDVSALSGAAALQPGVEVALESNPLSATACTVDIPALRSAGVVVTEDTCGGGGLSACLDGRAVNIPDPALEALLREVIPKPTGPILDIDLFNLDASLSGDARGIRDLTGLEYCLNLTSLQLRANEIVSLAPLAGLFKLTQLFLDRNEINSLSGIESLDALEVLSFRNNLVYELQPLGALVNLTKLDMGNNLVGDLGPLTNLLSLTSLSADANRLVDVLGDDSSGALEPLRTLTQLQTLKLSYNAIRDLTALSGLQEIVGLDVGQSGVSDLTPLSALSELTSLTVSFSRVKDLSPLSTLTTLTNLAAQYNQISDLAPIANLTKLKTLGLRGNPVCDLSPLVSGSVLGDTAGPIQPALDLADTLLSSTACSQQIPALESRGILVNLTSPVTNLSVCRNGGVFTDCNFAPQQRYYVSALDGDDGNQGTESSQLKTIGEAINRVKSANSDDKSEIFVGEGIYPEYITLVENLRIVGAGRDKTIIQPTNALLKADQRTIVVAGAAGAELDSLSVKCDEELLLFGDPPRSQTIDLVSIVDISMRLQNLLISGNENKASRALFIYGVASSGTTVQDCIICDVEDGLQTVDSAARFSFNDFLNIRNTAIELDPAAQPILAGEVATPALGDLNALVDSASNIIKVTKPERDTLLFIDVGENINSPTVAQANAWNGLSQEADIVEKIRDRESLIDVTTPLYLAPVPKGLLASTLFVTVQEQGTGCPVVGANVTLNENVRRDGEKTDKNGVYFVSAIGQGIATVRVIKKGYKQEVEIVHISQTTEEAIITLEPESTLISACKDVRHSADFEVTGKETLSLSELLRVIQLFNSPRGLACNNATEDGYDLYGRNGNVNRGTCARHTADYASPEWIISLSELLRMIQVFNLGGFRACTDSNINCQEDGFYAFNRDKN
jgi:Leucine-rich repeat (LRR) protein